MGLITCYECNRSVSTNAVCCPNCGNTRFIEQRIEENKREELENKRRKLEREQADKEAQKLGYANAYEKSVSDEKALDDEKKALEIRDRKKRNRLFIWAVVIAILYNWAYHNPNIRFNNNMPQFDPNAKSGREIFEERFINGDD